MKEELLKKSIQKLEGELLELRKDKVGIYTEMDIAKTEKINILKKSKEIELYNENLKLENKKLSEANNELDNNIALFIKREIEHNKNTEEAKQDLNTLILRTEEIKQDIEHLKTEKTSLLEYNSEVVSINLGKTKQLEKIEQKITESTDILNEINKNIKDFELKNIKLEEKDRELTQKESRLNLKEKRLNEVKKELFSKK